MGGDEVTVSDPNLTKNSNKQLYDRVIKRLFVNYRYCQIYDRNKNLKFKSISVSLLQITALLDNETFVKSLKTFIFKQATDNKKPLKEVMEEWSKFKNRQTRKEDKFTKDNNKNLNSVESIFNKSEVMTKEFVKN
jgi:hypothetical protein